MKIPVNCSELTLPIRTERLLLRSLTLDDLEATYAHRSHPEVCRYIAEPMDREEVEHLILQRMQPWTFFDHAWYSLGVIHEDQLIGELAFRVESLEERRIEIGYRLHPDAQGKGFASESVAGLIGFLFEQLNTHRIVAYCDTRNTPSYRVMERLGMNRDGCLRQSFLAPDGFRDNYIYSILASEWPPKQ